MTTTKVVRRFEIRVPSARSLGDVKLALERAIRAQPPGEIVFTIDPVQRPPLLDVRLEGAAPAVSRVVASIAAVPGARIQNDILRVRRNGSSERGPGRNGSAYPDLNVRVRIGADALPPASGSVPVTVVIVDSGLMVEHPAFNDHLWKGPGGIHGKQFIDGKGNDDISDQDGHGTLQAGTVLGVAVDVPVKFMVAKFFDTANPTRPDNAAAALDFAANNGARIMLLAWDVGLGSAELERAFRQACKNALVVIAAGNYGSDNDWHDDQSSARAPVRYAKDNPASTLTVMATDESDEKAWFSNYGRQTVDLAAPGLGITSTRRCLSKADANGPLGYRTHGGTSAAAAHIAGAAALLMSRYPDLTVQQVKRCLVDSVDRRPRLKCASGGRLNVDAALRCAAQGAKKP